MSTHSAECSPHTCLMIETMGRAPSMNAACGWTLIRKTSLLRKINPMMRRSSFTNIRTFTTRSSCDERAPKRPGDREWHQRIASQIQTRINLLFTMSEIPHPHPGGYDMRSDVSRTIFSDQPLVTKHILNDRALGDQTIWWSQTGSNRRPHACKARALPAELWPRTRRRMLRADHRDASLYK
jgi:hypothetical protein